MTDQTGFENFVQTDYIDSSDTTVVRDTPSGRGCFRIAGILIACVLVVVVVVVVVSVK